MPFSPHSRILKYHPSPVLLLKIAILVTKSFFSYYLSSRRLSSLHCSVLRLTLKISVDVRAVQTQMGSCPSTVYPIHSYQTLLTSFWLPVLTGKCLGLVKKRWCDEFERWFYLFLLLLVWPKLKHFSLFFFFCSIEKLSRFILYLDRWCRG